MTANASSLEDRGAIVNADIFFGSLEEPLQASLRGCQKYFHA